MLTSTGLQIKRLPDIISELESKLKLELGSDVDVSSDSLLGILNSIYAAGLYDQWALSEAVYNAFNVATAEGKQLDDLVALVGISRLPASATNGNIEFTGTPSTIVPFGTEFADVNGNTYNTSSDVLLSVGGCTYTEISVNAVQDGTLYSISVDTVSFDYVSAIPASTSGIIQGLLSAIGVQSTFTASANSTNTKIILQTNSDLDELVITTSSNLSPDVVTSIGQVSCTETGAISCLANTLTSITTPVVGLDSVNNPVALILGRDEETDEELRVRQAESVQIAGTATVPAIEASLGQVQGVIQAIVVENRLIVPDGQGRPGKSYECVVDGGTDAEVAAKIWETKPAGVETYGSITEIVVDGQGNNQAVRFSRPSEQYIWVDVTYTLHDEESFPIDGEDAIAQAIADFGNTLNLGQDVIPKRFYGTVYTNVSGIEDLTITMASSGVDPGTQPSGGSYLEDAIDINGVQVAKFDVSRIAVAVV